MTKSGTLYTNTDNIKSHKILIAARYSGAKVDKSSDFHIGETNKTASYLAKFPAGCVPAFQSTDGQCISDSNAIAYYVANEQLRGKTEIDAAHVMQWMGFADNEILPSLASWVFDTLGVRKENAKELEKNKQAVAHALALLDDYLRQRTYLVGERVTLADIACFTVLSLGFKHAFDDEYRKKYINVDRWFNTCVNQPEAKAILGEVKHVASAGKAGAEKPKKAAEAKPKAAAEGEDEEEGEHKAPESDPFGQLPPGTFKMDDWKRTFSNNDFTSVALPYFWQNFDKANYSMWVCEYKPQYAADLTQIFMTCNLVTGMYQRLDRMRKHSFGSMGVFGVKNDNTIAGIFVWRGHDLAFTLSEDLQVDYESYDWRKIDPESEEAKKAVEDYFGRKDSAEFKGKKVNQFFIWK